MLFRSKKMPPHSPASGQLADAHPHVKHQHGWQPLPSRKAVIGTADGPSKFAVIARRLDGQKNAHGLGGQIALCKRPGEIRFCHKPFGLDSFELPQSALWYALPLADCCLGDTKQSSQSNLRTGLFNELFFVHPTIIRPLILKQT